MIVRPIRSASSRKQAPRPRVPAIERAFSEVPPQRLYVDTNVCLDYLIDTRPRYALAVRLFQHLAACQLTTLYVSPLSWTEFAHVIRTQQFRDGLSTAWQQQYGLARWAQEPAVRPRYLAALVGQLEALLDQIGWAEVAITSDVRRRALQYVYQYNLRSQDAVHLACVAEAGVVDLASFDEGFRRVDNLSLWHDRIYSTPRPTTP
jgi:predicted nucleic acid-binding protein